MSRPRRARWGAVVCLIAIGGLAGWLWHGGSRHPGTAPLIPDTGEPAAAPILDAAIAPGPEEAPADAPAISFSTVTVNGQVLDNFGDVLGGGTVHVHIPFRGSGHDVENRRLPVDPQGMFTTRIDVSAPVRAVFVYANESRAHAPHVGHVISPRRPEQAVELVAVRAVEVAVEVVDPAGLPAPDVNVRTVPDPFWFTASEDVRTDVAGRARVAAPLGTVLFEATAADGSRGGVYKFVSPRNEREHAVRISLRPAKAMPVRVRCVSGGQAGLTGRPVSLKFQGRTHDVDLRVDGEAREVRLGRKLAGRKRATLEVGKRRFEFRWSNFEAALRDGELVLDLARRGTLELHFTSGRGEPLPALGLYLVRDAAGGPMPAGEAPRRALKTGADGTVVARGLPHGAYQVVLMPVSFADSRRPAARSGAPRRVKSVGLVRLDAPEQREQIRVASASVLQGTYAGPLGSRGQPLRLRVAFPHESGGEETTEDVWVQLDDVGPWSTALPVPERTRVHVEVLHPGVSDRYRQEALTGGEPVEVTLQSDTIQTRLVRVRFGRDLRPVGWVELRPATSTDRPAHAYCIKAATGTFEAALLPEGDYVAIFRPRSPREPGRRAARPVRIGKGRVVEVDLSP